MLAKMQSVYGIKILSFSSSNPLFSLTSTHRHTLSTHTHNHHKQDRAKPKKRKRELMVKLFFVFASSPNLRMDRSLRPS